eukprot:2273229-Alexandrium_andersonii.AAC.1
MGVLGLLRTCTPDHVCTTTGVNTPQSTDRRTTAACDVPEPGRAISPVQLGRMRKLPLLQANAGAPSAVLT